MKRWLIAAVAALLVMGCGQADDKSQVKMGYPATTAEADKAIRARLAKDFPNLKDIAIEPSAIPGLYVMTSGALIGYVSADGRHLIEGELVDLDTKENLTETRRTGWRKAAVAKISEKDMLIYEPEKAEHTVTVFTDPQCGYCKKFQAEIDGYLKQGIRIRYLFQPIFGDESKKIAEQVWCADDRRKAYSDVMAGKKLGSKSCKTPLQQHADVSNDLGVRGTPAIMTEDGRMLRGYMPPAALKAELVGKAAVPAPAEQPKS